MFQIDLHGHGETVKAALYQLEKAIELTRKSKEHAVCLIVGYGSTGGSHKIRTAVLECLNEMLVKRQIKAFILGSQLDIFDINYQKLSDTQKKLVSEKLGKTHNPGEVVVFI